MNNLQSVSAALAALLWGSVACSVTPGESEASGGSTGSTTVDPTEGENEPPGEEAGSDKPRDLAPKPSAEELATMASDERSFAVELFNALPEGEDNRAIAPTSLRIAFGMVYEGARTISETEIRDVLHFSLDRPRLHVAFNKIDLALAERNLPSSAGAGGDDSVRLSLVNQMFGRLDVVWLPEFLDVLAVNYGSGLRKLDIAGDPEVAREAINAWVEAETQDKITELLPKMSIQTSSTGVLVNALYLKAPWKVGFESVEEGATFTRKDGTAGTAAMMQLDVEDARYHKGEGFEALELPLRGDSLAMVFILPDAGTFDAYVAGLDGAALGEVFAGLAPAPVAVKVPRFKFSSDFDLKETMQKLGIVASFDLFEADFSGLATNDMAVSGVYHDTFLAVDEKGIEAAAASAVVLEDTESSFESEHTFTADRPFLFAVRDRDTDALLFFGRVLDPSAM